MGNATKFAEDLAKMFEGFGLDSNKAINPIKSTGRFFLGEADSGFRGVRNYMHEGDGIAEAAKKAYTKEGHLNYKAIAGSYIAASAAGRIVTGGGIYKDRNGNSNLIGVPFV